MARGPSAIYSVVHIGGYRVPDLQISNEVMEKALKGYKDHQNNICIVFRKRLEEELGRNLGWMDFNYMEFTKVRDIPSPEKKGKK